MERVSLSLKAYQSPPDARHIDVLDGVRALLVFLVGWYHIWQQGWLSPTFTVFGERISLDFLLRSGYIWVDGLLLLSGFLLYLPYTRTGSAPPRILPFYGRRLIRILPSYLLCVIPMFVLGWTQGRYPSALDAGKDLAAHLTFTHNLFEFSYFRSPINGALWTLAVEMQFYLLFPFLARAFRRFPILTYVLMAGAAFAFRAYAARQSDTSMYVNQLPAFLDVYANGFLAASAYAALRGKLGEKPWDRSVKFLFTVLSALCLCQLVLIARAQAASAGYEGIRLGQMERRFALSGTLACFMICSACSLSPVRFLLGNRVMRFLASVSFQFYIYHQLLAVQLKQWGFPPSQSPTPWQDGEYRWQVNYTVCCFLLALIAATLITYFFERPIARALRRLMKAEK